MNNYRIDKDEINELVKRIGMGDDSAYDTLYPKMSQVLYYFLLRYDLNKEDIQDLIIDTFTGVIQKAKNKMTYKNCFSWIITIAKNQFNNFRRKNHENKVLYDSEYVETFFMSSNVINSLSLKLELEKFDKFTQQILFSTRFLKFTEHETAKYLDISESTIKRRLQKIEKHFKENYKDE